MKREKFYFYDSGNLNKVKKLNEFYEESDNKGCIIGGMAVSAHYINFVLNKLNTYTSNIKHGLNKVLRKTQDVDIILKGNKKDNFENLIRYSFGKSDLEIIGVETNVYSSYNEPYLSFYFTDNKNSIDSFFEKIVDESENIEIKTNYKNSISVKCAKNIDIVLMKLITIPTRLSKDKKENDLIDINILRTISNFDKEDVLQRAEYVGLLKDRSLYDKLEKGWKILNDNI